MPEANDQGFKNVGKEIDDELPDQMELAFEDLTTALPKGTALFRARIHEDRTRTPRFENHELGALPPDKAEPGRANRKGQPVLYLSTHFKSYGTRK